MEGFGLPPAEAMSVGTPVLAADNSSLPEVVRKRECLLDATKPEALIDKLIAAKHDEERFLAPFPLEFSEAYGIHHYLRFLQKTATF